LRQRSKLKLRVIRKQQKWSGPQRQLQLLFM
jgi:hypothetical protein